ncbi:clotting factor B, partial [Trichonephila clavata]
AALYRVTESGGNRFLSAGSLINENFVLTAAHVFTPEDLRTSSFVVMLGTHTAKESVAEHVVMYVLRHPSYQQRYYYHDIALLRLERPVVFNNYVMPVCLPSPSLPLIDDEDLVGKKVTVMGWGDESFVKMRERTDFVFLAPKFCSE